MVRDFLPAVLLPSHNHISEEDLLWQGEYLLFVGNDGDCWAQHTRVRSPILTLGSGGRSQKLFSSSCMKLCARTFRRFNVGSRIANYRHFLPSACCVGTREILVMRSCGERVVELQSCRPADLRPEICQLRHGEFR